MRSPESKPAVLFGLFPLAMAVRLDEPHLLDDLSRPSGGASAYAHMDVVCVCFTQTWNPPALHTAQALEALRTDKSKLPPNVHVLIVDADAAPTAAWQNGAYAYPSVCLFRGSDGTPLSISRPFFAVDCKVCGPIAPRLLEQLLKAAAESVKKGTTAVRLDW